MRLMLPVACIVMFSMVFIILTIEAISNIFRNTLAMGGGTYRFYCILDAKTGAALITSDSSKSENIVALCIARCIRSMSLTAYSLMI